MTQNLLKSRVQLMLIKLKRLNRPLTPQMYEAISRGIALDVLNTYDDHSVMLPAPNHNSVVAFMEGLLLE